MRSVVKLFGQYSFVCNQHFVCIRTDASGGSCSSYVNEVNGFLRKKLMTLMKIL